MLPAVNSILELFGMSPACLPSAFPNYIRKTTIKERKIVNTRRKILFARYTFVNGVVIGGKINAENNRGHRQTFMYDYGDAVNALKLSHFVVHR